MTTCRKIFTFSWPLRGRGRGGGRPKRSAWPLYRSFFFDYFPNTFIDHYWDVGHYGMMAWWWQKWYWHYSTPLFLYYIQYTQKGAGTTKLRGAFFAWVWKLLFWGVWQFNQRKQILEVDGDGEKLARVCLSPFSPSARLITKSPVSTFLSKPPSHISILLKWNQDIRLVGVLNILDDIPPHCPQCTKAWFFNWSVHIQTNQPKSSGRCGPKVQ